MTKFSVVIPLYNKEREIVDTINSILKQSYEVDEIIIVDDGSTDESVNLIKTKFSSDKIRIIKQKNSGETVARNRAIEEARNEYIALLDADDLWEEKFLSEIWSLIEKYPQAVFYSTASKSIDESGKNIKNSVNFEESFQGYYDDFFSVFNRNYGLVNSSSVVIRKSIFSKGIVFPQGERKGGDLCYWLELSLIGGVAFSASPLSVYRLDASNRSFMIYKEAIVPCPIKWFYANQERLRSHKYYKSIRKFIYRNIFITVYGGFSLIGDILSIDAVIRHMKKNNDIFYILLYPAYWVPVWLLESIKKLRRKLR